MELLIVRHARPEHIEPDDPIGGTGPADPPLADVGHRQAERAADHLLTLGVDAIVTSPMLRARQTAAPLVDRLAMEPLVVDGVAEYDRDDATYVPAEVTKARIKAGDAEVDEEDFWRDPLLALAADERKAWIEGVVDGFESIIAGHSGRRVAVFCHGMVTSVWFAHILGIADTVRFTPDYCGLSRMLASANSDIVTVRSFNETHFLGDDHIPLFEK